MNNMLPSSCDKCDCFNYYSVGDNNFEEKFFICDVILEKTYSYEKATIQMHAMSLTIRKDCPKRLVKYRMIETANPTILKDYISH